MDEIQHQHSPELEPLEAAPPLRLPPLRHRSCAGSRSCYKAPLRVFRLLVFLILMPTIFLLVPLYMRYRVFSSQMYPMGMTDMRLIDGKVSTTWCQRQVVKSNTTFNAFVVPSSPELSSALVNVSMTRHMELQADMKEYWGFYLLHGSTVTVSACVSWPGASLIMIRGYKHLQECAYIGDDSSEEVDELIKAEELGLLTKDDLVEKLAQLKKLDGRANQPDNMKRHKAGVSFHDPSHAENATSSDPVPSDDITDHDPKELREILEHLHAVRQAIKDKAAAEFKLPSHLVAVAAMHRFRDTNVDRDEQQWLTFKDLDKHNKSYENAGDMKAAVENKEPIYTDKDRTTEIPRSHENKTNNGHSENMLPITVQNTADSQKLNETKEEKNHSTTERIDKINSETVLTDSNRNKINVTDEESMKTQEDLRRIVNEAETNILPDEKEPDADSKEIFEDVLKRLQSLGSRGQRVLRKLQRSMGIQDDVETTNSIEGSAIMDKVVGSSEELDRLRRVLVEAIDEERTKSRTKEQKKSAVESNRSRRDLVLGAPTLEQSLNEDDEARDYAGEEGLDPDGFAEHHTVVNETSPLDMSNSEFWSSFSSSEEALLECDGLILNLPLSPHAQCTEGSSDLDRLAAAQRNAITYRVPANGYYFFVFNSENEVQTNFINVRFDLQKTRYDVARTALRECRNSTDRCDLKLDMFSSQKVVLELPLRNNDSLWNEQFVVISECEPRTSIYLVCAIAVPLLILVFAFQ